MPARSTTRRTTSTAASVATPVPTPARRRLFRAVLVATPFLLLLLAELLLRLVGYGSSSPLFVAHASRPGWMEIAPDVGRRWFRGGPFVPTPEVEYFRADKPAGALRV